MDGGDTEDDDEDAELSAAAQPTASRSQTAVSTSQDEDDASGAGKNPKPTLEELDPEMAEWFKVDEDHAAGDAAKEDEGMTTEDDSDPEEVGRAGGDADAEVDLDEWFKVKANINDAGEDAGEKAKEEVCVYSLPLYHCDTNREILSPVGAS